jgi:hypothetical protein
MRTLTSARWTAGTVLLLGLLAGCGSEPPSLAPVRGRVLYRGTPLREGTVVFTPDPARGGNGPMARAEIQADGSYVLRTGERPGAVAGWHRITVLAVQSAEAGTGPSQRRALVPRRYSDPELSGISCQVKPAQENTCELRLE